MEATGIFVTEKSAADLIGEGGGGGGGGGESDETLLREADTAAPITARIESCIIIVNAILGHVM